MAPLDRPVRDLLTGRLVKASSSMTLRDAALQMDSELVGALLVESGAGVFGIVTERDLVRALADGADPDDARVSDYLTDDLLTLDELTPLWDVLRRMRRNSLRHVVVSRDDMPVGVVSMRAVVERSLTRDADAIVA